MAHDWPDDVEKRLIALETQNAVNTVHQVNVGDRLSSIEDTLKWLMRLVIGGLLVGVLTYVLQGGLAP